MQAFWRLQPSNRPAFHAMLAFPISLAPDRTIAAAAARPPLPPYKHIRITPGLSGTVVVSMPAKEQAPTVQVGTEPDVQRPQHACDL